MRPRAFAILLTLALAGLGACRDKSAAVERGAAPAPGVLSNGAALALSAPPARIVSLAPNLTEFLFALGAGDRVVGVTRFCDQPPAAAALPRVGGLVDLDVETVLSLRPDLVVALEGSRKRGVVDALENAGIPCYWTTLDSEDDVYRVARELARLVGTPAAGDRLVDGLRAGLAAVQRRLEGAPERRTLLVFGHEPLVVAGGGSFADSLVRRARGINVAGDTRLPFPTWPIETVVRAAPDVIIDAWVGEGTRLDAWNRWESIPAVHDGRVHRLTDSAVLRPGPRLPEALEAIARRIHPERFDAPASPVGDSPVGDSPDGSAGR